MPVKDVALFEAAVGESTRRTRLRSGRSTPILRSAQTRLKDPIPRSSRPSKARGPEGRRVPQGWQ